MNRYPIWKYLIILFALVISILYTIPNFFGESPAIQVSPGKATVKVTDATMAKVEVPEISSFKVYNSIICA